jgi:hypothetical protein
MTLHTFAWPLEWPGFIIDMCLQFCHCVLRFFLLCSHIWNVDQNDVDLKPVERRHVPSGRHPSDKDQWYASRLCLRHAFAALIEG